MVLTNASTPFYNPGPLIGQEKRWLVCRGDLEKRFCKLRNLTQVGELYLPLVSQLNDIGTTDFLDYLFICSWTINTHWLDLWFICRNIDVYLRQLVHQIDISAMHLSYSMEAVTSSRVSWECSPKDGQPDSQKAGNAPCSLTAVAVFSRILHFRKHFPVCNDPHPNITPVCRVASLHKLIVLESRLIEWPTCSIPR